MNRFTRSEYGKFALIDWEGKVRLDEDQAEVLTNALAHLAAYEDTGLTPEEIAALRAEVTTLREALKGAQIIAESAGQTIREQRAEVEQLRAENERLKAAMKTMIPDPREEVRRMMEEEMKTCSPERRYFLEYRKQGIDEHKAHEMSRVRADMEARAALEKVAADEES